MDVWYSPGTWLALSGPHIHALTDLAPDSPVLAEWSRAAQTGGGPDELLAVLMQHGLATAPSFAFAQRRPDGMRVVLRGDARVWCADGRELSAEGAPTWRDGIIGIDAVPIRLAGPHPPAAPTRLPLVAGVAFAASVDLYLSAADGSHDVVAPEPPGEPDVVVVPAVPVAPVVPDVTDVADVPVAPPPPVPASAGSEVLDEPTGADDYAHLFGPTTAPPSVPPPVVDDDPSPTASVDDTLFTRPEVAEPVAPTPTPTPTPTGPEPVVRAAADVATPPVDDVGVISAFPWDGVDAPGPAAGEHAVPQAATAPAPATWSSSEPPAPEPPALSEGDHTVARSALPSAATPVGPTVLAAYCPVGHLSPVHAQLCRVCGRQIAPNQQPMTIPRPTLGVLRLPGGQTIPLDRSVVLGRAPVPHDAPPGEQPHAVSLASPEKDISRNHAEIRLDGWHVLAVDLGSVNGTVVVLPGRPPQRLRPEEPVILERGADVVLADEVTVTFEVPE